jgi:hypothetical protein
VRISGWHSDRRYAWGRRGGVNAIRLIARRCADCGHVHAVDPEWDDRGADGPGVA